MRFVKKKKLHYAWVVCFGCALLFFCTCGLSCNVFSVYAPFVMKYREFTKTQISMITSCRSLFCMAAIYLTAGYYKRLKLRQGMLLAGLTCAVGYTVYGLAVSFPSYLLGSALVGFGYGLGAMVPISMVLEHWFLRDRTLAVSLVSAASGLATIGIPSLITAIIERFGMETAFITEGITMAALVSLSFLMIRDNPSDISIQAFGEKEEEVNRQMRAATATFQEKNQKPEKKRLPAYWWYVLYAMIIIAASFNSAGWSHLSLLATTEGYVSRIVAISLSVAGTMLMTGKFLFGIISSKITLYKTSMIYGILVTVSTALCCVVRLGTPVLLFVYGIFGLAISQVSVGVVAWMDDWCSEEERDQKVRFFQFLYAAGSLVMGIMPGMMADACGGSYIPFYAFAAVCSVIVNVIVWMTYKKLR